MSVLQDFDWRTLTHREYVTFFNNAVLCIPFHEIAKEVSKDKGFLVTEEQIAENYLNAVEKIKRSITKNK